MRGRGELRGFSQWVQLYIRSPNKLWRSNSIFNLWWPRKLRPWHTWDHGFWWARHWAAAPGRQFFLDLPERAAILSLTYLRGPPFCPWLTYEGRHFVLAWDHGFWCARHWAAASGRHFVPTANHCISVEVCLNLYDSHDITNITVLSSSISSCISISLSYLFTTTSVLESPFLYLFHFRESTTDVLLRSHMSQRKGPVLFNGQFLFLRPSYAYTLELQSSAQADKKWLVLSFFILSLPPGRGEKKEKKMGRYSGCRWRDIYNFHCSSTIRRLPSVFAPPSGVQGFR